MFLHIYFSALRRSLKLVIQTVTYCDANSGANTSVHYTIYDFIESICIRKIPHVSILYCSIVQTNLSIAYIQQKYDYPYRIFGVLHKTYCVNIVTWYVKEMYILKIAKYSTIKIWKNSLSNAIYTVLLHTSLIFLINIWQTIQKFFRILITQIFMQYNILIIF